MAALLAVDLGLRTGLALYGGDGRLAWYRSHHFGSAAQLRQGVPSILDSAPQLSAIALEGGGNLAEIWIRAAERRNLRVIQTAAETWRAGLLYERERRSAEQAKQNAGELARRVIAWAGAPRPTALRHDTAEAILLGLWAVVELGWLERIPPDIRR
jgi:hypothetical protein